VGYFHPDQHFSIIEFASYKLGITSADQMAWEFPNKVRPTIQVYLFIGFYYIMDFLGLSNGYSTLTVLRIIVVILNFLLFNYIILKEFKNKNQKLLIIILLVGNFSWIFPYYKTLFNSENFGAIFYFGSLLLFQHYKSRSLKIQHSILVGFLFSLSFYFRFQMGFAMVGLAIWFLFYEKIHIKHIIALSTGFLIGIGANTLIDSLYYGDFNFIPYTYWKINIIDGRAANTGESPIWYYLADLAAILSAPLLSFVFLFYLFKGFFKNFRNPYVLSVVFFLLFHFLIGHKEERFLFPVFGILPVILGYGLDATIGKIHRSYGKFRLNWVMKAIVAFSLVLNFLMLYFLLSVPYSQSIYFAKEINQYFRDIDHGVDIICYQRTPYDLPSGNFHAFYWHFKNKNVHFRNVEDLEEYRSILKNPPPHTCFAITFDKMVNNDLWRMDNTHIPTLTSSKKAISLNRWLHQKDLFIIPDVWMLYEQANGATIRE
jgi:phosphatidylinositol glycan class B